MLGYCNNLDFVFWMVMKYQRCNRHCARVLALIILFLGVVGTGISFAEEKACSEGIHAYEDFQYEEAVNLLGKCLENEFPVKEKKIEIHKTLGFCFLAFEMQWQAREHFIKTLELDPTFDPTNDPVWGEKAKQVYLDAKIEFEKAKEEAQTKPDDKLNGIDAAYNAVLEYRKSGKFSPDTMKRVYEKFLSDFSEMRDNPYYFEVEGWQNSKSAASKDDPIQEKPVQKNEEPPAETKGEPTNDLIIKGKRERMAGILLSTIPPIGFFAWALSQDNQLNNLSKDDPNRARINNQIAAGYAIGSISLGVGIILCGVGASHIKKGEARLKRNAFLKKHKPMVTLNFDRKYQVKGFEFGFSW